MEDTVSTSCCLHYLGDTFLLGEMMSFRRTSTPINDITDVWNRSEKKIFSSLNVLQLLLFHRFPLRDDVLVNCRGRVRKKKKEDIWLVTGATSWSRGDWGIRWPWPSSQAPSPTWAGGSGWSGRRLHVTSRTSPPTRQTGTRAWAWWCAVTRLEGATEGRVNNRTEVGSEKGQFTQNPGRFNFSFNKFCNYWNWSANN